MIFSRFSNVLSNKTKAFNPSIINPATVVFLNLSTVYMEATEQDKKASHPSAEGIIQDVVKTIEWVEIQVYEEMLQMITKKIFYMP